MTPPHIIRCSYFLDARYSFIACAALRPAPMLLLAGGWVLPEALPAWLRSITFISPLKHYMELGIGLLVRGAGIEVLWQPLLKLIALGGVVLTAGYIIFVRKVIAGR